MKKQSHSRTYHLMQRLKRFTSPISGRKLNQTLGDLIGDRSELLMVHSSLSKCGHILGGPGTVIESLKSFCDTLVMPTHTYCYPTSGESIGPLFNPVESRSRVGAITEHFRKLAGVRRSIHPTHSVAAAGPLSSLITAKHETCDTPCGRGTPYATLIHRSCAVLMFGATNELLYIFSYRGGRCGLPLSLL